MYGGQPLDEHDTSGIWSAISPAGLFSSIVYGSLALFSDYHDGLDPVYRGGALHLYIGTPAPSLSYWPYVLFMGDTYGDQSNSLNSASNDIGSPILTLDYHYSEAEVHAMGTFTIGMGTGEWWVSDERRTCGLFAVHPAITNENVWALSGSRLR